MGGRRTICSERTQCARWKEHARARLPPRPPLAIPLVSPLGIPLVFPLAIPLASSLAFARAGTGASGGCPSAHREWRREADAGGLDLAPAHLARIEPGRCGVWAKVGVWLGMGGRGLLATWPGVIGAVY